MPAPYPVFPYVAGWDNSFKFESDPIVKSYGKGGIETHARRGAINQVRRTIDVGFNVPLTTRNTIETFLSELGGLLPFWFYYSGTNEQDTLYTCSKWQWTPLGYKAWRFSAEFRQVFRY